MDNVRKRSRPTNYEDYSKRSRQRISARHKQLLQSEEIKKNNRKKIQIEEGQGENQLESMGHVSEDSTSSDFNKSYTSNSICSDNDLEEYFDANDELNDQEFVDDNQSDTDIEDELSENDNTDFENDFLEDRDDNQNENIDLENDQLENTDDEQNENEGDQPVYTGARITIGESLLAILTFFLNENLTGTGLVRLLELIELHCPTPNICKKTAYLFKQYFKDVESPLERHYFCSNCFCPLAKAASTCEICPDTSNKRTSYFIALSVINQLQQLYDRTDFLYALQSKFNREKKNENNYEDIYDGNIYKEKSKPGGPLSNPDNISFMWNTDGISLFKSSNYQIWPMYLSINELPFHLRMKKENLVLAGLWFGPHKPVPSFFLHSTSIELNRLKIGVDFNVSAIKDVLRVQAHVICGTCDLPAKALFLNVQQYNGTYGCSKCKILVERVEEFKKVPIYKYQEELPMRLQKETIDFARLVVEKEKEHIFGIKGPSIINELNNDYIRSTVVDSMHCVYLGVMKALLLLWFSSKHSDCKWSFSESTFDVDQLLCCLTPPEFITRLPRSISQDLKHWKAHEFKAWMYYYSLPILDTIMIGDKRIYFDHYKLLVSGISLLNQSSISDKMIDQAEHLLREFVKQFENLYHLKFMTANLHSLLHLPQTVRDFGPLFVSSCFAFENINGQLSRLVTGTRFSGLQISSGLAYFMAIPRLIEKIEPDSIISSYIYRLMNSKKKYKSTELSPKLYAIGTVSKNKELPDNVENVLHLSNIEISNVRIFFRLMKLGTLYVSQSYQRMSKTNSSFVKYSLNGDIGFGRIHCFACVANCTCQSYCTNDCDANCFAIINKYFVMESFTVPNVDTSQFYQCYSTNDLIAINVKDLIDVCFYIKIKSSGKEYIVQRINSVEFE